MSEGNRRTGTTSGADTDDTMIRPADDAEQTVIRNKDDFYKRPTDGAESSGNGQSGGEQVTLAQRVMRGQPVGAEAAAEPKSSPSAASEPAGKAEPEPAPAPKTTSAARSEPAQAKPAAGEPAAAKPAAAEPAAAEPAAAEPAGGPALIADPEPEPATKQAAAASGARRTRKARLRLARVDPWSVMKTAFLFSIAGGIVLLVAVYVIWGVIGSSGLFEAVDQMVQDVIATPGDTTPFRVQDYVNTDRVMGVTALLAFVDVVIFTALATLGSFLYNLAATMLGGLEVTLAED
ncbi:MAG: DUF3566 domain-containing protein [Propionibacteriaceae bacterium]